jgi:hypothetical protein
MAEFLCVIVVRIDCRDQKPDLRVSRPRQVDAAVTYGTRTS